MIFLLISDKANNYILFELRRRAAEELVAAAEKRRKEEEFAKNYEVTFYSIFSHFYCE